MSKKILTIFLAIIMILCTVPVFAADQEVYKDVDITDQLILEGSAYYDKTEDAIMLCPAKTWSNGKAKYPFEVLEDFQVKFDYKIGGGKGADGIILAFYAQKDSVTQNGGYLNFNGCGGYGLELDTHPNTNDSQNAHVGIVRDDVSNHLVMVDDSRVEDNSWHSADLKITGNKVVVKIDGDTIINKTIAFDKTYRYMYFAAATGEWDDNHYIKNVRFTGRAAYANASDWAVDEMDKAEQYALIPSALKGKDMTKQITRYEFAALSVALYESITGKTAPVVSMPFTDTTAPEVAKAYGLGITKGVSETEFNMNLQIPREQVATMLARTMKASIPSLNIVNSHKMVFADDAYISDYAKDSVYYMAERGIITGVGGNKFAPRNTTAAEEATMYANATREQAIAIAVRAFENLK